MPAVNVGTASVTIMPSMSGFAAKVDALSIGGGTVGYAALAKAVCDESAARMVE